MDCVMGRAGPYHMPIDAMCADASRVDRQGVRVATFDRGCDHSVVLGGLRGLMRGIEVVVEECPRLEENYDLG